MLRRLGPLLLALWAWSSAWATPLASSPLPPPPALVSIHELKPTQMEVGKIAARSRVDKWKADAADKHMSLQQYATEVLVPKFAAVEMPVVIDPKGAYRNTDGHHRVAAMLEIGKETGVDFKVRPNILADYRGRSEAAYARHFIGWLKKGQFTPEVQALSPVERIKHLPSSYAQLKDSPIRSAVGMTFNQDGIDSRYMRDYVEFRAGDRLLKSGLLVDLKRAKIISPLAKGLPNRVAIDPRVQDAITKRLNTKPMRTFLLSEAKDEASRAMIAIELNHLPN